LMEVLVPVLRDSLFDLMLSVLGGCGRPELKLEVSTSATSAMGAWDSLKNCDLPTTCDGALLLLLLLPLDISLTVL